MNERGRVIISPLIAVSVQNQAELIKKLILKKGYDVEYKTTVSIYDIKNPKNKAFLWFTLANIRFLGDAVFPYLYMTGENAKPKAVYVTIEGIPTKANILCSSLPRLEFIANSRFTKDCLERAGLNVIDVVHHAVDYEMCLQFSKEDNPLRRKWKDELGDRAILLYVGRNDPRKGLDKLTEAWKYVYENFKDDVALFLFTEGDTFNLEKYSNVVRIGNAGTLNYDQVLRMIGACDYLIFPSVCEGFGLPVLEGNAMGKPVIHAWFPPLSEFSSKEFNFVFGYQHEVLVNQGNVQYWRFHQYRPELLAEMIGEAVKIYKESRSEYEEYCKMAQEHASKWDYRRIYPKLLKHLGVN